MLMLLRFLSDPQGSQLEPISLSETLLTELSLLQTPFIKLAAQGILRRPSTVIRCTQNLRTSPGRLLSRS